MLIAGYCAGQNGAGYCTGRDCLLLPSQLGCKTVLHCFHVRPLQHPSPPDDDDDDGYDGSTRRSYGFDSLQSLHEMKHLKLAPNYSVAADLPASMELAPKFPVDLNKTC